MQDKRRLAIRAGAVVGFRTAIPHHNDWGQACNSAIFGVRPAILQFFV